MHLDNIECEAEFNNVGWIFLFHIQLPFIFKFLYVSGGEKTIKNGVKNCKKKKTEKQKSAVDTEVRGDRADWFKLQQLKIESYSNLNKHSLQPC